MTYQLETVIDVIYQPLNSPLLQSAKSKDECHDKWTLYVNSSSLYADELFLDAKLISQLSIASTKNTFKFFPNCINWNALFRKTTIGKLIAKLTDV